MKKQILLLIVAVLLAVSPALAVNGPATSADGTSATGAKTTRYCGVYEDQIVQYMYVRGIMVVYIEAIPGMCDVVVQSADAKKYIVHITDGIITGHNEADF